MAAPDDDLERLRGEVEAWRRRAEVAEAVAAERLARAEAAERALHAAEAALAERADQPPTGPAPEGRAAPPRRPGSLLERWRRYTETIN